MNGIFAGLIFIILFLGLIKNASADYLEIVPCLSMIPEQNRPDWKIWCKGINPKVKNHRYFIQSINE